MKKQKSWKKEFIIEQIWTVVYAVPGFFLAYIFVENVWLSLPLSFVPIMLWKNYHRFVLLELPESKFYRLPQITCEGTITEVNRHIYSFHELFRDWFSDYFLRLWITVQTTDGQKIRAYISPAGGTELNKFGKTYGRGPAVGDVGTFTYRKDKKHCYFGTFVLAENVADDL